MKAVLKICNGNDKTLLDESLSRHKFHCPNCDMHLTSLGLCPHCGTRWELPGLNDDLFCREHQIPMNLVDYEDEARYECPECQRERGEALGLI